MLVSDTVLYDFLESAIVTSRPFFYISVLLTFFLFNFSLSLSRRGHGACAAQYLGGDLAVSLGACVCENPWSGPLCDKNLCALDSPLYKSCSGNGVCKPLGDEDTRCECDQGYSGINCENSCDGICKGGGGVFPYGCAGGPWDEIYALQCGHNGGCYYPSSADKISPSMCTYFSRGNEGNSDIPECFTENDCRYAPKYNCTVGACGVGNPRPDGTACNSKSHGICAAGECVRSEYTSSQSVVTPSAASAPPPMLPPTYDGLLSPSPASASEAIPSPATNSGGDIHRENSPSPSLSLNYANIAPSSYNDGYIGITVPASNNENNLAPTPSETAPVSYHPSMHCGTHTIYDASQQLCIVSWANVQYMDALADWRVDVYTYDKLPCETDDKINQNN